MISYRPFLNSDPPAIAEIWRRQAPTRGLIQSVTPAVLERHVFAKPYFEHAGLILAVDDQQPIGFVHAGFGPADDFSAVSHTRGVTSLLMVVPREDRAEVSAQLLARSEAFLRDQGAEELFAAGAPDCNPFYLGLYGGSELSGLLVSDQAGQDVFRSAGYVEAERRVVWQLNLRGFRPLVDRRQMQIRRKHQIEVTMDPPARNWWEACTTGQAEKTQFALHDRQLGGPYGVATFWDMEPLSSDWGIAATGILELEIQEGRRRDGLGTFLAGEALRQLQSFGMTLAEVHVPTQNDAALGLFRKLGFAEVDQSVVLKK